MSLEDSPENVGSSEQPPSTLTADDKQWAMLAHLSAMVAMALGGATFLGPLIVWIIKKDQSKFVDYHGKEALNFQLNILIYTLIAVAVTVATCGVGAFVTVPFLIGLGIYVIIISIIAGMKANNGEWYKYPMTLRMIK
jgi:uncharacterized Tic20 family protein